MSDQLTRKQRYMVNVDMQDDARETLVFTFVPADLQENGSPGNVPARAPQFIVSPRLEASGIDFDWSATRDDPGAARAEIEAEIAVRMNNRAVWIDRVASLVDRVEHWAKEIGWSTRRLKKTLDDARIGKHRVPSLLMQQDTYRILLEPVGRSAPGAAGVVDLYLMPAYDDIASFFYYGDHWNIHYLFHGSKHVAAVREVEAVPLSKEAIEKILTEMKRHAA